MQSVKQIDRIEKIKNEFIKIVEYQEKNLQKLRENISNGSFINHLANRNEQDLLTIEEILSSLNECNPEVKSGNELQQLFSQLTLISGKLPQ